MVLRIQIIILNNHKVSRFRLLGSTHVCVFHLKGPPKPETKLEPQHCQLSTPLLDPPGLEGPLQALEVPLPDFRTSTRREERTIAQQNQSHIDNAKDNQRYFGLHLVGVQPEAIVHSATNTKYVRSVEHLNSDVELKPQGDVKIVRKDKPSSEASIKSSWEEIGHRWVNTRAQSDPGIDMRNMQPDENAKRLHREAAMSEEHKKEQDTDLQVTPPITKWRLGGSPPPSRTPDSSWAGAQVIEEEKEFDNDEHAEALRRPLQANRARAPTPTLIPIPSIIAQGLKCSPRAAIGQGLKSVSPSGNTTAVRHRKNQVGKVACTRRWKAPLGF